MKGNLLNINELKNMNGQYVYIVPKEDNYRNEEGKAKVIIKDIGFIIFRPNFVIDKEDNSYDWCDYIDGRNLNKGDWLDVYEWVEESEFCYKIDDLKVFDSKDEILAKDILNDIIYEYNYSKGSNVQKLQSIVKIINKYK